MQKEGLRLAISWASFLPKLYFACIVSAQHWVGKWEGGRSRAMDSGWSAANCLTALRQWFCWILRDWVLWLGLIWAVSNGLCLLLLISMHICEVIKPWQQFCKNRPLCLALDPIQLHWSLNFTDVKELHCHPSFSHGDESEDVICGKTLICTWLDLSGRMACELETQYGPWKLFINRTCVALHDL